MFESVESLIIIMIPIVALGTSAIVLARSRLPMRVILASVAFGTSQMLLFTGCYFLWTIGGIAFHQVAVQWATGLSLTNFVLGIVVIRLLRGPEPSPSQRDVAPPDTPANAGG